MNKRKKYILSVITILVIVAACTFGIFKYVGMKKNSTPNNNVNINTDGNKSDKETTLLVEKLSTLTNIDDFNSELKLPQKTVDILKKFGPTVYYAIDNSEGYDRILFRIGGYLNDNKINGINEFIGSYRVDGGKLKSTGDDLGELYYKFNNNDKLKWNQINFDNKEHDKKAAGEIVRKYFNVSLGGGMDNMIGVFAYASDFTRHVKTSRGINIVPLSLAEITDMYNSASKDTYNSAQIYEKVSTFKNIKYKEVDDSYKGNEEKYNNSIANAELIYFKKDKMYLAAFGGIGGVNATSPSSPDKWTIEGDKVIIPLINNFKNGKIDGQMVLRLNNKKYEGGQSRSKYYIESRTE